MTSRKDLLGQAAETLAEAGVDDPHRDARILLAHVEGCEVFELIAAGEAQVSPANQAAFEASVSSRAARQPVSQIIGRRAFWKHVFKVTPDVLDPRPETEHLIEAALEARPPKRILDLGTGTGCIVISLLEEFPEATALATDISPEALEIAQENARAIGVDARLDLRRSDWFENVAGQFDLIVSNPPYIAQNEMSGLAPEVANWEPHLALSPGRDGLAAYRSLANGLAGHLAPHGRAIFETGVTQAGGAGNLFRAAGFDRITTYNDLTGRARGVIVQKSG